LEILRRHRGEEADDLLFVAAGTMGHCFQKFHDGAEIRAASAPLRERQVGSVVLKARLGALTGA